MATTQSPPPTEEVKPIVLGVCAMAKKAKCKPMQETLGNLSPKEFQIIIFDEKMILEEPVETWPVCEALICFYSTGFPQEKAEKYVEMHKPFLVNDLVSQRWLRDRRKVYEICKQNDIPVPFHLVINRDGNPDYDQNGDRLIEGEDYLEVDGVRIEKPFVEKPVDADDHRIFVYYPRSSGGGRKELFRKVGDRSSEFYPDRDRVRREGSYVYEEFLATEGSDVKVYAVTGAYAHAEARKSPTIDGRVLRDENQLEMRFPVTLSSFEKQLALRVCSGFKQRVCGFDMLRSNGKTYVCDVNGWSFVKRNTRHMKDCAMILSRLLKNSLGRQDLLTSDDDSVIDDDSPRETSDATQPKPGKLHEELRAVITIIRHGDRTPKQKLKLKTSAKKFLAFLKEGSTEVKLKTAADLSNILSIINEQLEEFPSRPNTPATPLPSPTTPFPFGNTTVDSPKPQPEDEEREEILLQARAVLEIGGTFKGINRKVQLKATKFEKDLTTGKDVPTEVVVIIKWGGVLTPLGRAHAEQLGKSFRERLYPGVDGLLRLHATYRHDLKIFSSDEGRVQVSAAAFAKGLLDLEGHLTPLLTSLVRKGDDVNQLLDDSSGAMEEIENAKASLRQTMGVSCTSATTSVADAGDVPQRVKSPVSPQGGVVSVKQAIAKLREDIPGAMERLHLEIKALANQLKHLVKAIRQRPVRGTSAAAAVPSRKFTRTPSESLILPPQLGSDFAIDGGAAAASLGFVSTDPNNKMIDRGDGAVTLPDMLQLSYGRWEKLARDFYKPKTKTYDISKLPDVYDSAKYDVIHNRELLNLVPKHLHLVYHLSKCLADIVVPQEYGETPMQKFVLGSKLAKNLAEKIRGDLCMAGSPQQDSEHRLDTRFAKELGIKSTDRHVLTRVYFTSESHMHSILNILRFAHLADSTIVSPPAAALQQMEAVEELDYLSHVVLRLFEVTKEDGSKRSIVRVAFSPGIHVDAPFDERTKTIQKVEVGYVETEQERIAANHLKRYNHAVHRLPPASPLIPLWNDVSLADLVKLFESVETLSKNSEESSRET